LRGLRIAWHAFRRLPAALIGASLAGWFLLAVNESMSTFPLLCVSGAAPADDPAASIIALVNTAPLAARELGFALMLLAMMPPLLSGPLSHVWHRSLRRRRLRAVVLFVAGYGTVWLMAGVPLMMMALLGDGIATRAVWWPTVLAVALAIAWQASPLKQSCLNRCHGRPPLATFGFRAEADALRYGVSHAVWCVGACWAMMLLPLAAGGLLHLTLMLAVMVVALVERVRAPEAARWGAALPGLPRDLHRAPAHQDGSMTASSSAR
jgi:predicted metal-binding membrane protein